MAKKELIVSAVYCIKNLINNRLYIGSTSDFYKRIAQHKYELKCNKHSTSLLQLDYNKYGVDYFKYSILIFCDNCNLRLFEQLFIDGFKPYYNCYDAIRKPNKPKLRRELVLLKASLIHKGNDLSAKYYYNFMTPSGIIIPIIKNLNKFCRDNHLDVAHMSDVYYGKRKSHKGWTVKHE